MTMMAIGTINMIMKLKVKMNIGMLDLTVLATPEPVELINKKVRKYHHIKKQEKNSHLHSHKERLQKVNKITSNLRIIK